jgi:predicted RNA-binding protein with PIN domain
MYLIDGYNVIFSQFPLGDQPEYSAIESARDAFVTQLGAFGRSRGAKIMVVFDVRSKNMLFGIPRRQKVNGVDA